MKGKQKYDFFISHASEDKNSFVKQLAIALEQKGFTTWYDEFTLELGHSLTESIQEGIKNSLYGIIVLSKNFFSKKWTKKELGALLSREIIFEENILLPIWLDVTHEEVFEFSPLVADKFAIKGDLKSMNEIIEKLSRRVGKQVTTIQMLNERINYLISCNEFERKREEIEMIYRLEKLVAFENENAHLIDGIPFEEGQDGYTMKQDEFFFLKGEELRKEYKIPKGIWESHDSLPQEYIEDAKKLCIKWINRTMSKNKCEELFGFLEEWLDTDTNYILFGFPYSTFASSFMFEEGRKAIHLVGDKKTKYKLTTDLPLHKFSAS